jgi:hypothetical protein
MIDFSVDVIHRLVTTQVAGKVTFGEFTDYLQRILRAPGFNTQFDALIIAADAAAVPGRASLELIKPLVKAWSTFRSGVKWAIVLPDAGTLKFAESAVRDLRLSSVMVRCFDSEAAARTWLEPVRVRLATAV